MGDFDFAAEAMEQVGAQLHFNRIAVKPGMPMTFATADKKIIFGLPGNPVAVFLMFHLFVLPSANRMAGDKSLLRYCKLPLACDVHRWDAQRMGFLPCRLTCDGTIEPVEYHGTAHLSALLNCDGFFIVPKDVKTIPAGQKAEFISLKGFFE